MDESNLHRELTPPGNPVVARRRSRRAVVGHGEDHEIPVLFRIPDLRATQVATHSVNQVVPESHAESEHHPSREVTASESPSQVDRQTPPRAEYRIDYRHSSLPPTATFITSTHALNSAPLQAGQDLVDVTGQVPRPTAAGATIDVQSTSGRRDGSLHAQRSASVRRDLTEPSVTLASRDRRRRRDDEVSDESQAMTKQWATVLVLVAVISASFYLLNRPRYQGETVRDRMGGSATQGEIARKQKNTRQRMQELEPIDDQESRPEPISDRYDSEEPLIDDPDVPATLIPTPSNPESTDDPDRQGAAMLNQPNEERGVTLQEGYPATDPSRYEYGRDPYATERASATRAR